MNSSSHSADTATATFAGAMDAAGWRPVHTRILFALGLGWMLDAFEVTLVGNVLPILRAQWSLGALESTLTISLWLAGILLGALAFGWAADRFGRRRLFVLTLLLYAAATFAAAFSISFWMFLGLRVVAAIGVGAEYSAVNAAAAELMPVRWRGRAAALVMSFWPLGGLVGGGLTLAVLAVAPPHLAWRIVFGFGALIALFALWARRSLPESPRWLLSQGRADEAQAILAQITGTAILPQRHAHDTARSTGPRFAEFRLLWRKYRARLALGAALDFSEAGGYYGLFALVPLAIIPALHLSFAGTPLFFLAGGGGALAGALVAAWLIERAGRKRTVTGFYAGTALAMGAIAAALHAGPAATLAAYVLASALANGSWIAAYPAFAEVFPTRARATGIGASVAAGRVAAGFAPPLFVFLAGRYSVTAALVVAGLFYLIGVVAMLPWIARGPEARGLALENLAESE